MTMLDKFLLLFIAMELVYGGPVFKKFSKTDDDDIEMPVEREISIWSKLAGEDNILWSVKNHWESISSAKRSCSLGVQILACVLLDRHNSNKMTLWDRHPSGVQDNAYALNNIIDTCAGKKASRSSYSCEECENGSAPGGSVCLNFKLLSYLNTLSLSHKIQVNELAGACHSCTSKHYSGRAVDLHKFDTETANDYILTCNMMNGGVLNETNHVHCSAPEESRDFLNTIDLVFRNFVNVIKVEKQFLSFFDYGL